MNDAFLVAAVVLVLALLPLGYVALRSASVSGLVALALGGAVTTMALVCVAIGTGGTASSGAALVCAVMTWVSGLVYARFLDREP